MTANYRDSADGPARLPVLGQEVSTPVTSEPATEICAAAGFRAVLSHFASGVVIVTALDGPQPIGMTFQSFFSVSLNPPLIALSPARTSTTWRRIARAGAFCVNVLSRDQAELCRTFGAPKVDRFSGVQWSPSPHHGAPVLNQVIAWLECSISDMHEAGDHFLVVARVDNLGALPEATGCEPLVIYRRALGSFSP